MYSLKNCLSQRHKTNRDNKIPKSEDKESKIPLNLINVILWVWFEFYLLINTSEILNFTQKQ